MFQVIIAIAVITISGGVLLGNIREYRKLCKASCTISRVQRCILEEIPDSIREEFEGYLALAVDRVTSSPEFSDMSYNGIETAVHAFFREEWDKANI